jgi:hypothetical protein
MPELDVTEEQLERLDALRSELETAFVDGYGHVRRRDAVDYLLDTYTPPVERRVRTALDGAVRNEAGEIDYPALQSIARNTDGVKGSGTTAEEMYRAVLEAKVREAGSGGVVGLDVPHGDGDDRSDDTGASAADPNADTGPSAGADSDAEAEVDPDDGSGGDDAGAAGASDDESEDATGNASSVGASADGGGGSQLQAMMNLLETHEDRWRKAESGDAPYEVDLPDGGTETARTKDDVKRILFRNY